MGAMPTALEEFQECLKQLRSILALVGAGISVRLGLAIGSDHDDFWNGWHYIDLQTPDAFFELPSRVWQYYAWKRAQALGAVPNRGHKALVELSKLSRKSRLCGSDQGHGELRFATANQNVDGLLARSGHCPELLHDLHGSLFALTCPSFSCNYRSTNYSDSLTTKLKGLGGPVEELNIKDLPLCPICDNGQVLRPGVVWDGESLPLAPFDRIDNYIEHGNGVDLVLVIGTSGTVYPARNFVDRIRFKGGKIAVFNTEIRKEVLEGNVHGTWGFQGDAAETLPRALEPLIGVIE